MPYRTIDLCAGIGGIRKGFEMTGEFENVLSSEVDKYACRTYAHLYGDNPENDLTSEAFKQLVEGTEYDVLLAGFLAKVSVVKVMNLVLRMNEEELYFHILPR